MIGMYGSGGAGDGGVSVGNGVASVCNGDGVGVGVSVGVSVGVVSIVDGSCTGITVPTSGKSPDAQAVSNMSSAIITAVNLFFIKIIPSRSTPVRLSYHAIKIYRESYTLASNLQSIVTQHFYPQYINNTL